MKTYKFQVTGMTCSGCEGSVNRICSSLEGYQSSIADRNTNSLTIQSLGNISLTQIKEVFRDFPKYAVSTVENTPSKPWFKTYYPLLLVVSFLILISVGANVNSDVFSVYHTIHTFMTGFFLTFSFFKLLDIQAFSQSFSQYDLIAKKLPNYGKIYPFIELGIGIACLLSVGLFYVYIAEIVIMSAGLVGVIQSNIKKQKIQCACLGTVFQLPMSTITIVENSTMIALGIYLLLVQ
ncbi:MAG: heavy-metal-associated domain-containing protein [Leadbetterella sp.]